MKCPEICEVLPKMYWNWNSARDLNVVCTFTSIIMSNILCWSVPRRKEWKQVIGIFQMTLQKSARASNLLRIQISGTFAKHHVQAVLCRFVERRLTNLLIYTRICVSVCVCVCMSLYLIRNHLLIHILVFTQVKT